MTTQVIASIYPSARKFNLKTLSNESVFLAEGYNVLVEDCVFHGWGAGGQSYPYQFLPKGSVVELDSSTQSWEVSVNLSWEQLKLFPRYAFIWGTSSFVPQQK